MATGDTPRTTGFGGVTPVARILTSRGANSILDVEDC